MANHFIYNIVNYKKVTPILEIISNATLGSNLRCLMKGNRLEYIIVLNSQRSQYLYKNQFNDFYEYFIINLRDEKVVINHPDGGIICFVIL
jgi:hypothetical protein